MIYFFTGAPGSGKTLRAIYYLVNMPVEHNWRPIFTNITDLKIPGKHIQPLPDSWQTAPEGAVFVIDEVQKIWPSTGKQGLSTKADVLALDEHRKGGYDFYLITQHPTLVDSTVRKFVTMHEHLVRASGREMCRVFSKNRVWEVGDPRELKSAESSFWKYPREYYDYYKSADVHVVRKFKLPFGLKMLLLFIITAIIYIVYHVWSNHGLVGVTSPVNDLSKKGTSVIKESSSAMADSADAKKVETPGLKADDYVQRVPGRPETAPLYDSLRVPTQFPVIVGCISFKQYDGKEACNCYTQQATLVDVAFSECKRMTVDRRFQPYMDSITPKEKPDLKAEDSPKVDKDADVVKTGA